MSHNVTGESLVPDLTTEFGNRVRRRLQSDAVIWLTTVGASGTPQPNPVWFVWEGTAGVLTYNRADSFRVRHIRRNPRVSLHFDSDGDGGDIVVFTGDAETLTDHPPVARHAAYAEKYRDGIRRISGDPETFGATYSVPVRIRITRIRGF